MPNTFIDLEVIGKKMLPRLLENLLLPSLCYKDYSNEYVNGLGTKIQVKKPIKFTANEFTQGGSVSAQNINEESVTVELNKMADVTVEVSSLEMAMKMGDQKLNNVIEGMAVALAQKINADGLKMAYKSGKIMKGSTTYGLGHFSDIRKQLNKEKAPLDGRFAIWSVDADAEFTQLGNLVKVNEAGSPDALREGEIGRVYGLDNYMAQTVAEAVQHSLGGTFSSASVDTNDKRKVEITCTGNISSCTLAKGDIIKFTKTGEDDFYGGIESVGTPSGTKVVITFNQEVPYDGTAMSVEKGTLNFAMQKDALAFVTRPLVAPHGADATTVSYNGIGIRLVRDYNITTKKETISADILYNFEMVEPECAVTTLI